MMSEITETKSIAEHFAEHVQRQPDAPALIWDGEAISYRELADLAESSYADLEAASLAQDRPVGIRAKKSPEAIRSTGGKAPSHRPQCTLPGVEARW